MKTYLILPLISLLWIFSEIWLVVFKRAQKTADRRDAGSIVWLNIIIYTSVALAVAISFTSLGFIPNFREQLRWIGLSLITIGLFIRWIAILTLRHFFTVDVAVAPEHKIIRKGCYRFIRHPSYLGSMISFLGLGLALTNWLSLLIVLIPITAGFIGRIKIEENALLQTLGAAYQDYCTNTWRLLPFIY